ncbi:uncharacterized protein LOC112679839 isoform X2 [Sipha flava]|uniref:Uncharacterized protein LOC112679839 isoform X2 n=1 Tax=Sipha flava TaxID=143950 RepID=A0A8B8F4J3_9HEMI|nr:uncharacterized protein LOC112679839 isoform X2 [Sipha flava]
MFIALYTDNNISKCCKSMGSIAQYVINCATQFIFYTFSMLEKDFYSIISSDESTTNFLISKNIVANNENTECIKCGSAMNLYLRKEMGKERRILRCKRKECQTTQSLRSILTC